MNQSNLAQLTDHAFLTIRKRLSQFRGVSVDDVACVR